MTIRHISILALAVAIIGAVFLAQPALAGNHDPITPVTLCHAHPTGEGNSGPADGYVVITVSTQGALNGHQGHPNDLIPMPVGGCPLPPPDPVITYSYAASTNCDGWTVTKSTFSDDVLTGTEIVESGAWTLPFELESATPEFVDAAVYEPEECLQEPPTDPTPTPTDEPPPPPTDEPRLPSTGPNEASVDYQLEAWQIGSFTWAGHAGVRESEFDELWSWWIGTTHEFRGVTYTVVNRILVDPTDTWVVDYAGDWTTIFVTCSNYDGTTWTKRLIVFLVAVN